MKVSKIQEIRVLDRLEKIEKKQYLKKQKLKKPQRSLGDSTLEG